MVSAQQVVEDTLRWLERAVIGLDLCPFAKAVYVRNRVHVAVTTSSTREELLDALRMELRELVARPVNERETTLLVAPFQLQEFLEFSDFLRVAEGVLKKQGLMGVVQLASFHPGYQFADTDADDITNCTNRAPYPTLHLLREASIEAAVKSFPGASSIYEKNLQTLRTLGPAGWAALQVRRRQ